MKPFFSLLSFLSPLPLCTYLFLMTLMSLYFVFRTSGKQSYKTGFTPSYSHFVKSTILQSLWHNRYFSFILDSEKAGKAALINFLITRWIVSHCDDYLWYSNSYDLLPKIINLIKTWIKHAWIILVQFETSNILANPSCDLSRHLLLKFQRRNHETGFKSWCLVFNVLQP